MYNDHECQTLECATLEGNELELSARSVLLAAARHSHPKMDATIKHTNSVQWPSWSMTKLLRLQRPLHRQVRPGKHVTVMHADAVRAISGATVCCVLFRQLGC
jgi:hypothetical protein